jgi:SAM-dependent methyltransferase
MAALSTDIAWEEWGRRDPYFGVITNQKFRRTELTSEAREEFFESGRAHVKFVFDMIRQYINPAFQPASIVDFGCGVGRLLVHFSPATREVVGLDVSPSMLEEAKRNCDEFEVSNVQLLLSDDQLSALSGSYDLIHSFIVFQHIPPERGREIFRRILPRISAGGVGALHFSYAKTCYAGTYGVAPQPVPRAVRGWPAARTERQPGADPEMQMNPYHLNEILFILQTSGVSRFHVEFTDHGGELGVFVFFQIPL